MSFWRYKLLETVVSFAMFPLFVIAGVCWFALWLQFVDIERNRWAFFLIAAPFLFGWLFLMNRVTRKAEKRWTERQLKKGDTCSPKS